MRVHKSEAEGCSPERIVEISSRTILLQLRASDINGLLTKLPTVIDKMTGVFACRSY